MSAALALLFPSLPTLCSHPALVEGLGVSTKTLGLRIESDLGD